MWLMVCKCVVIETLVILKPKEVLEQYLVLLGVQ